MENASLTQRWIDMQIEKASRIQRHVDMRLVAGKERSNAASDLPSRSYTLPMLSRLVCQCVFQLRMLEIKF